MMSNSGALEPVARVREAASADLPALHHPGWASGLPWLVQGVTTRGGAEAPFDLRLFGDAPAAGAFRRWDELRRATGMPAAVHAPQVHGAKVRVHGCAEAGLRIAPECDGHVTRASGLLLAVSVADCVPVSVVDPHRRVLALLHAGWRGAAAGVLERGLQAVAEAGGLPEALLVHLGPSICGECYEVGPEVFEALDRPRPEAPTPIDLRGVLAERARAWGVPARGISVSEHCTRCGTAELFSHRGGDAGRQVAFLGIRP